MICVQAGDFTASFKWNRKVVQMSSDEKSVVARGHHVFVARHKEGHKFTCALF